MVAVTPTVAPTSTAAVAIGTSGSGLAARGNSGWSPRIVHRTTVAVIAATPTGIRLLGFHSNRRSSTPNRTAANGALNVAAIPPAAPATRRTLRSAADRWRVCPNAEPRDPPVMMIGPSAPNGPPDPIDIAAETGLR